MNEKMLLVNELRFVSVGYFDGGQGITNGSVDDVRGIRLKNSAPE